jgi:hypothetical protein
MLAHRLIRLVENCPAFLEAFFRTTHISLFYQKTQGFLYL